MRLPNQAKPMSRPSSSSAPADGLLPAGFFGELWDGVKSGFRGLVRPAIDILGAPACMAACAGNPMCMQACQAGTGIIRQL